MPAPHLLLRQAFGVDLRSLALFRFVLGTVLLCVLSTSACSFAAFYTDSGIAPRSWLLDTQGDFRFSLYFLNGSIWFNGALLLAQSFFALMLMLGWRTRLASIVSFALWASLMSRNPSVLTAADSMIAGLLFWGMFLPLGARYSVDNALTAANSHTENQHLSWASAGLLIQAISPYFFSALAAYSPDVQAYKSLTLYYLLNQDTYTSDLGHWLLNFPGMIATLSRLIFGLSLISPLLIFSPFVTQPLRLLALTGLLMMQIGALLFLDIGHLPWVCIAALCILPGAQIWEWLNRWDEKRKSGPLRIYFDREHVFSRAMCLLLREFLILPRAQIAEAQETSRTRSLMQANQSWVVLDAADQATMKWPALVTLLRRSPLLTLPARLLAAKFLERPGNALYDWIAGHRVHLDRCSSQLFARAQIDPVPGLFWRRLSGLILVLLLLWSFAAVQWLPRQVNHALAPILETLQLDQRWNLYSISALENDGWLMIPSKLADNSEFDLLRPDHGAPDFSKPDHVVIAADGLRWLSYRDHLWQDNYTSQRRRYAQYLCRQWNTAHVAQAEKRLVQLSLIYMLERTPPPGGSAQVEQRILSSYECLSEENRSHVE